MEISNYKDAYLLYVIEGFLCTEKYIIEEIKKPEDALKSYTCLTLTSDLLQDIHIDIQENNDNDPIPEEKFLTENIMRLDKDIKTLMYEAKKKYKYLISLN